jgi:hypothetical protein
MGNASLNPSYELQTGHRYHESIQAFFETGTGMPQISSGIVMEVFLRCCMRATAIS